MVGYRALCYLTGVEHPSQAKEPSRNIACAREFETTFGHTAKEGKEKGKAEERKWGNGRKKNERKKGEPSPEPHFPQ